MVISSHPFSLGARRRSSLLWAAVLAGLFAASPAFAQAQGNDAYKVRIGGMLIDPKLAETALPANLRLSEDDLTRHRSQPSRYIVQLNEPPSREGRAQMNGQLGLALQDYLPNLSYVEKLSPEAAQAAASDPRVRAVIPFQPAFKLSPTIGRVTARTEQRRAVPGLVMRAVLFPDTDPNEVARAAEAAGARNVKVLDDRQLKGGVARLRFNLPSAEPLPAIARVDGIRWIEEVAEIINDDTAAAATIQSGTETNPSVWNKGLHGEGQIIGIIDNQPADIKHCFFLDPADNTPRASHRKIVQLRNRSGPTTGPHATFTAGNAAGDDFNNPGTHLRRGSAWASRLAVGNNQDLDEVTLLSELSTAASTGAAIHTNSWHDNTEGEGQPASYNQNAADVDAFTWNNEDQLVLGSAGNNGEEQGPPGTAKNAVGVGATRANPNELSFADGNPGPTADGRRKPDIMSPGCGIQSATVNTVCDVGPRNQCATSYATPHAAGATALVRQYFMQGWYPSGSPKPGDAMTPSGALLKAVLINSTLDMTGIPGYPSDSEGWGLARLDRALFFAGAPRRLQLWDTRNATGLTTGDVRSHTVSVAGSNQPLKIVLVWTEPPSAAGTNGGAINNLDLSVISPSGAETYLGNVFGASGASATGGSTDLVNNSEVVLVNNPAPGQWKVNVAAKLVAIGNPGQGYALVATGDITVPSPPGGPNVIVGR